MALEFSNFPIEIQEKILSCLTGQSLFIAAKVCKLWTTLCGRIARERFRKIVPAECLFEEEENRNESLDEVWLRIINYHYLQLCFANNMLDYKKEFVFNTVTNNDLCYCSYGPLVFIGDDKSFINVYNTQENSQPKNTLFLENGSILQLQIVNHEKILIALSSSSFEFFTLPRFTGKDWDYNMKHLTVIFLNHTGPLNCYRNVSVGGNHIAIVTNPCEVSVFRLNRIQDEIVQIIYVSQFVTEHAIVQTGVWSDEIIILLTTGEVVQWFFSSEKSNETEAYQEIRYQNPAWVLRGRIFCSTIISSKLLGYWHMDRGATYWLIGSPNATLVRCRDLGTMFSADTNIEDVLCVALKQRLLACGTKEGKSCNDDADCRNEKDAAMDRWVGKIALITGASGGVGAVLASQLVKKGMIVVGLARRVEKIDDLKIDLKDAPGKLYSLKADITKDEDIRSAFSWVKKNLGSLHVLVNNAGTMNLGRLTDGDPDKWRHIFNVNVLGLSVCTRSAFQLMNESGVNDGHIIHINSIAGHTVPVYDDPKLNVLNVYPASKFAVTALTETLRQELKSINSKIKITSVSPGFVKTDFALNAAGEMDEDIKDYIRNRPGLKAEDVVDTIIYALSTPPNVQIHELIFTAI